MTRLPARLVDDLLFLSLCTLGLLAAGTLLRALLLFHNLDLAAQIPTGEMVRAFLTGLRFDLIVASYILLPVCLFLLPAGGFGQRKLVRLWLAGCSAAMIFLGIVELDFYHEFHTRLNSLVFEYLREDPETVVKMLWAGFPVTRYLVFFAVIWGALQWLIRQFHRRTGGSPAAGADRTDRSLGPAGRAGLVLMLLLAFTAGARGTLRTGPPLRWGDAFTGSHVFSNHLGLNGTFTLIKAASATGHASADKAWRQHANRTADLAGTRTLLLTNQDTLLDGGQPLLRQHQPANGYAPGTVRNIVLIIMESFAGAYVGALGDNHAVTPAFDRLARQGLLFERFFANGTHTHQGMFASVACFPNLPGHEYLMQQPEGAHPFSGLPALFHPESDNNVYVYNGDFRWDNQEGFFRNQGMDRFIGRDQIDKPKYVDAVWGVSDEDVFHQAIAELDQLADRGPFYAVIQTLSNHTPFSLPQPLPVPEITDAGSQSEHLTAMRYADWAIGQFFDTLANKPYYKDTAFILVGDHGFGNDDILSAVDLNRFRVPLLIIAPGIQEQFGHRSQLVASQVDIVPTAMGLLGRPFDHQCWGRDLLTVMASGTGDPGFAVIKPSGSDQTAAIIVGNDILTQAPGNAPELGHLDYQPGITWQAGSDEARRDQLQQQLRGYIATALTALSEGRTGLGLAQRQAKADNINRQPAGG